MEQFKSLPHNDEAEQSVIAAVLNNSGIMDNLMPIINYNDFYKNSHQILFKAMSEMSEQNQDIDIVTLTEKLKINKQLEAVGGITYLSQLQGAYMSGQNIKNHALLVKEKSNKRKIIKIANNMMNEAYEEISSSKDIVGAAEDKFLKLNDYTNSDLIKADQLVLIAAQKIEDIYKNGGVVGIPTKSDRLNQYLGGFRNGEFYIIAARPSMGKTAFMLKIAEDAGEQGKTVGVFSLEMPKEGLMFRIFSTYARIDLMKLQTGNMDNDEWSELAKAMARISKLPVYFDDKPAQTVQEIKAKAKNLKVKCGLDMIILDYLSLLEYAGKSENRTQEVSRISKALKNLARELNIPVVVLSQLSRACEARADHRPMMSDLRESGSIEQDSDCIMFLYRDEYYNKESEEKNIVEVIFGKNRNGKTGTVKMAWLGQYQIIGELDYTYAGSYDPKIFKK